ncbi:MAG: carbon-nitrogen hydrolase family protein [Marmoricola sp.]
MTDQLRVRLVQRASGLDPAANRELLESLGPLGLDADLVVLPEAFARDFGEAGSPLGAYAEPLDGPFVSTLTGLVASTGAAWVAGMFERGEDEDRPLNTLVLADTEGVSAYRKIHLYDSFGYRESETITSGPLQPTVVEVRGVRIGLMTCYDLRFPELARTLAARDADVLVVPAAWVAGDLKVDHWRTLLRARAIENTVWVLGAGQPGPRYTGHSMVVAPDGEVVAEAGTDDAVLEAVLDLGRIEQVRRTNPSLANRRM